LIYHAIGYRLWYLMILLGGAFVPRHVERVFQKVQ
jgi:hypothetical protein